jgi:hypothetical protein
MSEEREQNELSDAEIAERMDRALRRMAITPPKPRKPPAKLAAPAHPKRKPKPKPRE